VSPAKRASRVAAEYTIAMGIVTIAVVGLTSWYGELPSWYDLIGYSLAACLLATRTIRLSETLGTVSISFIFVFAAIVELGPLGGVIAAAASGLGATLLCPRSCRKNGRAPVLVIAAAVNNVVLAAAAAGWAYAWIDEVCLDAGISGGILPAFVVIGVYYMVNSLSFALIAAISEGRTPLQVWSDNLSWTVLPFYVGGAVVVVVHVLAVALSPLIWLAVIPPAIVIHLAMALRVKSSSSEVAESRAEAQ
jgi:hypothetical protein